jgi:cysteinyl-tRNA synthetase
LHGAFLLSKGEKVSKSKGGLYTVSELEALGFKAIGYRYFCLTAHYRTQLNFTLENLQNAQNSYDRLRNIIEEFRDDGKTNEKYLKKFEKAINDDLDMPKAIQVLWKLVRDEKAEGKIKTIREMEKVLGLNLLKKEKIKISEEIRTLVEEREEARKKKDFNKADEIRNKIQEKGFSIKDTPEGPKLEKNK